MPSGDSIHISIRGIGRPVSFKNRKRIWKDPRSGRPFLGTEPRIKQWMKAAKDVIESELSSMCRTRHGSTTPECLRRFAMSSLPLDDNWQVLEIGSVHTELVPKGQEGVMIVIERIN